MPLAAPLCAGKELALGIIDAFLASYVAAEQAAKGRRWTPSLPQKKLALSAYGVTTCIMTLS